MFLNIFKKVYIKIKKIKKKYDILNKGVKNFLYLKI